MNKKNNKSTAYKKPTDNKGTGPKPKKSLDIKSLQKKKK